MKNAHKLLILATILASLGLLGAGSAHAATYTMSWAGWLENWGCNPNTYCVYGYAAPSELPAGEYHFISGYTADQIGSVAFFDPIGTVVGYATTTYLGGGEFKITAPAAFTHLGASLNVGYSYFIYGFTITDAGGGSPTIPNGIFDASSTPLYTSSCGTSTPIFELTGSAPFFQINDPIPDIQIGACNAIAFVFQMTDAQKEDISARYTAAGDVIGRKPPFGYFTLITSSLGSFAAGSSTVALLSASSTDALSPIFSPIDTGFAACIGLVGIFWTQRRIKHIQP